MQRWGGPIEVISPGDVVQFAPGEKHWHGASPTTAMSHIAIQEYQDGSPFEWMGKVSGEQYPYEQQVEEGGNSMTMWSSDELDRIGTTEELEIAPRRRDGTLRNSVTIWVVRHGDNLYIRSYRGQNGSWFRAAQRNQQGRIRAGGVEKEVRFVDAAPDLNDQIDAAYRNKYGRYPQYVAPMLAPEARATTIELIPRTGATDESTS